MDEIIVGKLNPTKKDLKYSVFLGKEKENQKSVYVDIDDSHVMLICGKRGQGKSYTMGVLCEGIISKMKKYIEIKENLSLILIDTMGIFWTMQSPSKNYNLLESWELEPEGYSVVVCYPYGIGRYKENKVYSKYFHLGFSLRPSELVLEDWLNCLDIASTKPQAILLLKSLKKVRDERGIFYSVDDIINRVEKNSAYDDNVKLALINKLENAKSWGIFSDKGLFLQELIKPSQVAIIDLSLLSHSIRSTVISILCKKIFDLRSVARVSEELAKIGEDIKWEKVPLVWIFFDEAHQFVPKTGKKKPLSAEAVIKLAKESRQRGISLVFATQQPGALSDEVLTQCDTTIIHRITAKNDVDAIGEKISDVKMTDNNINIIDYLRNLPKNPGYALIHNDLTENLISIKIRPRISRHGGSTPKLSELAEEQKGL
ncbi:MAG: ATP-binding protein [Methanomicrobia archaeon]|nr:ATP-binding protein [Methanomicrobia archaeon]